MYVSVSDKLKAIELRPCPNCGESYNIGQNSDREWHIYCFSCGMRGPAGEDEFRAADAWNTLPRCSDIKRVERERDWLAAMLSEACTRNGSCPFTHWHCEIKQLSCSSACVQDWLVVAKEATCQKN